jgi:hypothetical protein
MKKVTTICWLGICFLAMFCTNFLLSLAAETDTWISSGRMNVLLPEGPQDIPNTAKPVYPLEPDQPIEAAQPPLRTDKTLPANQLPEHIADTSETKATASQNQLPLPPAANVVEFAAIQSAAEKGTKNWLSITYAPKFFQFEIQQLIGRQTTVYADLLHVTNTNRKESVAWPNYLQITDERGRGSGWTLNVKQEAKFSSSLKNKTEILTGAELSLGTAQGKAELLGSGGNNPYKPGKVQEVTTLIPNESVDLIVARPEEGLGTWIYRFGNEKTMNVGISLTFPTQAYTAGGYLSTLTWAILDAPVN